MSEKENKILETFKKVLPDMSEIEREKLLSFGEGIAFALCEELSWLSKLGMAIDGSK